jgi:pimeloyl-ACP methyl ester carboxylesterase
MDTITVAGARLAYEVCGDGDPIVLLHPGFVANAFAPLLREPALAGYRLIAYHRRGYGASTPAAAPFSVAAQAADCLALLDGLSLARAHLVGHSFGANIALEVARTAPARVWSLSLLEPPLPWAMRPESAQLMLDVMGAAAQRFAAGALEEGVETWLTAAFGPGWQEPVEQRLPGGVAQVLRDGAAAMGVEAPALQTWRFGPDDLAAIQQPTLAVYHVDPVVAIFDQVQQTLMALLPQVESMVVPNATHMLQIQNPRSVGDGLAAFWARHPLG